MEIIKGYTWNWLYTLNVFLDGAAIGSGFVLACILWLWVMGAFKTKKKAVPEPVLQNEEVGEAMGEPRECVGVIPHHGAGLSEAEDAMRPAGVVGKDDWVTGIDPETGLIAKIDRKRFYDGGVIAGVAFTHPDMTGGIKVDIKPEVGTFDADKFDIWTGKPKDDGVTEKDDRVTVVDPDSGLRAKIPRSCFNSDGVLDVLKPINPPLRLIMEKAPFGGIYYKLQDRKTLRLIQNGIAGDFAAVLSLISEADRERIYETRRYGLGVGE